MIPIAIIGGGPAGLLAGIAAGSEATLFEANPYCGKKLLLSGAGQCNFTNALDRDDFLRECGTARNFIRTAYYAFDNHSFISLLEENGCPSFIREDGKVFPRSLHSADVRDSLLRIFAKAGGTLRTGKKLTALRQKAEQGFELSFADGSVVQAEQVILAGGGLSYPQTGSDGSLLLIAKSLKHKLIPTRPALCGLEIKSFTKWAACAGIALRDSLFSFCSPSGRIEARGDILFTHKGLSGPVVINNSFMLCAGSAVSIRFAEDAEARLLRLIGEHPKKNLANLLKHLDLPEALITVILDHLKLNGGINAGELRAADRKVLSGYLGTAVFTVKSLEGYDQAMATTGGINTLEVNPRTMGSRFCPGLYFAGEMLDYDLPTGGFNIQIAASTGWLAGRSALASLRSGRQA